MNAGMFSNPLGGVATKSGGRVNTFLRHKAPVHGVSAGDVVDESTSVASVLVVVHSPGVVEPAAGLHPA